MTAAIRSRLTYANVMATLAVVIALGGTSYAAIQIPRNGVKGRNIARNAITSPKVKNHSLLAADFAAGQLPTAGQGAKGDTGGPGKNGTDGKDGTDGHDGAAGSAAAYGHVIDFLGAPVVAESKNMDRATQTVSGGTPLTGSYCVHATVPRNNVTVSLDQGGGPGFVIATSTSDGVHCDGTGQDAGYNIFVQTFDTTGAAANRPFYIVVN